MLYTEIPTQRPVTPLLDAIDHPQQLRQLEHSQLLQVADELRQYILYAAGQSGGHFGANLGVVELTVALHYCFNTPNDRLVWDVGHQAYPHKILTGRREQITTIRAKNGLAAFPAREESVFDTFGVGHSSTAISAGLGMSLARRYQKDPCEVVCIVGDGAMTAGMAFEAMNDAVAHDADLIVVLNDNDMSISCSTGGFAKHLAAIWEKGHLVNVNEHGEAYIQPHPKWTYNSRLHQSATDAADNLFKAIGFDYFGPFDGHDVTQLVQVFNALKKRKGPRLVHVYTKKGKGFAPAEADPITYHAIGKINAASGGKTPPKYSDVFGEWLCDEAAQDERLLAITPAMCEGSGMVKFAKQFPQRFFDVAIAEQHAVTLAAGMACEGLKPVVAIYSTFLQRGYDQLIHDVALQNLDVTFGIDRAGLVGEDGPTHAGAYDYAYMRTVPNMVIMAPKDENECRQMLHTAYAYNGPAAVRYPRGAGVGVEIQKEMTVLELGKAEIVAEIKANSDEQITVLAFGSRVMVALEAAEQFAQKHDVSVCVVNMRFVKPLDEQMIRDLAEHTHLFVTVEEHAIMGGAGSAVNEFMAQEQIVKPIINLGLPDSFLHQATHNQMLQDCGLDAKGILNSIERAWLKVNQVV
ncbi:TPA: 1-deoxy-D-xylulose-5-phosphate synthase [Acinetobacter baumannii]|jgi:1-deoxy-D-xylulose-5-phosphate synthase|uniref:1-deoxy-D-xylulose-5-phosphate synthase n=9 Tax=Acinetobacter baumannii TaxID=470 RepID=V5VB02_ACIBA|nr:MULTISPECIES: 1-deoxy-D-xylulose-5-phosphate synthase [Acinetobacter]ADX93936.1 1-deoxy-D-xylulose-5-phosphate synthase [Acinetobacter baumannii TCDC-AB0715]AHX29414.1 1-deoxy-D-xylulose-5-phosphate synthase [Acinetobacter baumannii AC12]AHX65410.1 1-deoxy-D-xylulose-5-phosphate synthase [Acinetobacter baumannii AC30]EMT94275.1 1-deoxy-D-xylulose-5-phosphate synthase [Acinetobacter baumannii ABNIH5]ETY68310.1 1-deoxy-D-xylulose-5-phosphate synthase [Acinetobacter baumannii MDR_MMC4]EXB1454